MAGHEDNFHHVRDFPYFELPGGHIFDLRPYHFEIPGYGDFQITKYMVLQVVAGLLTLFVFKGLVRRIRDGRPTTGRFWNFWEAIALYIRDQVVRPTLGGSHHGHDDHDAHDGDSHGHAHEHAAPAHSAVAASGYEEADRHLPFIWSCFFYILFCNLLGAIPMLGSPTGAISMTLALAITVFVHNVYQGSRVFGFVGFWKNQCPPMDVPPAMKVGLVPLIWCLEVVGLLIKHLVLAIRLFSNMMGGHTVLGVMLAFIAADGVAGTGLAWLVTPASIFGQVAIGLLELFVAFLQAYVFSFLATMFLSACMHSH